MSTHSSPVQAHSLARRAAQLRASVPAVSRNSRWAIALWLAAGVAAATTLTPTTLPPATVGVAYSQTLTASGGTSPYGFALVGQPAWLSIGSTGATTAVLSGTPPNAFGSPLSFDVKVTDKNSVATTFTYTLTVNSAPLTLGPSSLAGGTVGTLYSQSLSAAGGSGSYTYSVKTGALPPGLSLNSSTGAITGTPTTTTGSPFSFTAQVSDGSSTATGALSIAINPAALAITNSSLASGSVGSPYSQTLTASGGSGTYTYSISSGTLPPGLSLNGATGAISGTPTSATGSPFSFTAQVNDGSTTATKALSIAISPASLAITTASLPGGSVGTAYSQSLTASGGSGTYTYSIAGGTLPPGLALNSGTGAITGNPTTATSSPFSFTAQVNDGSATATKPLSISISPPPLAITTSSLPAAAVGTPYSQTVTASGGSGSYTYSVSAGSLPPGLSLNSATGAITGNPTTTTGSPFSFTLQVNDGSATATKALSIVVNSPALTITTNSLATATVGVPYSQTVTASGGSGSYTFSLASGALPGGLALNSGTGAITGNPTTTSGSPFNFTLQASDGSTTATKPLAIAVNPPSLAITTGSLSGATVGTPYSQSLNATGGSGAYTYSIASGALPGGLTLNSSTGAISGTPTTTAGSPFNFTAQVSDGANTATKPLSITVSPAPLVINTSSLSSGVVGASYSQTLTTSGGSGSYTYSIGAGALPGGLSLNGSTGAITGTPTTTAGSPFGFTVNVTDGSANASKALSITINPPPLVVTTSSVPAATVGTPYAQTIAATGGSGAYTFSISAGALPGGLSLNSATGAITGSPTSANGSPFSFTVQVNDGSTSASKAFSFTVNAAPLTITPPSLPSGTVGSSYASGIVGAGGGTTPYSFALASGALPVGLSLNTNTGAISGTPTATGSSTFTLKVTDSGSPSPQVAVSGPLSLTINPPPLVITTTSLPSATAGGTYSQTVNASGGTSPYTFAITGGSLPAGLALDPAAGAITGSPTTPGSFAFSVGATDSGSPAQTTNRSLSITINPAPLVITTASPLASGASGVAYSQALAATGGVTPYTFSVNAGSLPPGLNLSPGTGAISGSPTTAGTFNFTVQLTDNASVTTSKPYSITIAAGLAITTAPSLPSGAVGSAYAQTIGAVGGTPPYSFAIANGALPAGLNLNATTGAITGSPTTAGNNSFSIQVTDSASVTATKGFTLPVVNGLTITTSALSPGTTGVPFNQTFAATGGTQPFTFTITSGALPNGLSLNPGTGALTGTPSSAGAFNFTVQVTDNTSLTALKAFTATIAPALIVTTPPSLPGGSAGASYSATLSATGGTPPYSWNITSGSLPSGLSLSPSGSISGTPSSPGTFVFSAQVTDSASATTTRQFTIIISSGLAITTSSLPSGTTGSGYAQSVGATGGTPPYSFSVAAGSLPGGLNLNSSNGAITGTPNSAGNFNFTIQVNDNGSLSATKALSINIAAPFTITTTSLPNATTTVGYSQNLAASGGTPPYAWTLASGSLPPGLALSRSGAITGTPTSGGSFTFTVQAADSGTLTATRQLTILVQTLLTIRTTSLPGGVAGATYNQTLSVIGGTGPYSWTVISGSLPNGLSLSPNGAISGVPTTPGLAVFTVQASDSNGITATQQLAIGVLQGLSISTNSTLSSGSVGSPYSQGLTASGGTPPYTFSATASQLPPGLSLGPDGTISGTPTAAVIANFLAQATDASGVSVSKQFTITIGSGLTISTAPALPGGTSGFPYSLALATSGGSAPFTWSVTAGTLPAGLSLGTNGVISGTPSSPGQSNFTVQVVDSVGASATKTVSLAIAPPLAITSSSLPGGTAGAIYSQTVGATGGTQPFTWTLLSGSLPDGLSLNASSGAITGTAANQGTATFTLQVTDAAGASVSNQYTIVIGPGLASITDTSLPSGTVGVPYSQKLSASGGTAPFVWSDNGSALPPGLTLAPDGTLSGTPNASGTFIFTARVTDSASASLIVQYTLTVTTGLSITNGGALPNAVGGSSYSESLTASGGSAPYAWSVTAGALPDGLSLDSGSGVLAGAPSAAGNFSFTVQVTDAGGATATRDFTLAVGVPALPAIGITGLKDVSDPASQSIVNVTLASPFPVPVSGTMTLEFVPDAAVPADDPSAQFATGGRSADFTIPANSTTASFSIPQMLIQTGTVAGTINLRVTIKSDSNITQPPPVLLRSTRINRSAPVIRAVRIVKNATGFEVRVTAYSTPRELTQATVTFAPVPGQNLQTTILTVPLADTAKQWYQNPASAQYGSLFVVSLPFTIQGAQDVIQSITISLANNQGTSAQVTTAF